MTNDEVVAQVFMLYLAGHETTANTLTFVSYELALNQEVQDRVVQEIQDQIGEVIHLRVCASKLLQGFPIHHVQWGTYVVYQIMKL